MRGRDVAITFLRWTWMRAVFHQGYWLVASLYLVVDAGLSAFQLVFLGTVMGVAGVLVACAGAIVALSPTDRVATHVVLVRPDVEEASVG